MSCLSTCSAAAFTEPRRFVNRRHHVALILCCVSRGDRTQHGFEDKVRREGIFGVQGFRALYLVALGSRPTAGHPRPSRRWLPRPSGVQRPRHQSCLRRCCWPLGSPRPWRPSCLQAGPPLLPPPPPPLLPLLRSVAECSPDSPARHKNVGVSTSVNSALWRPETTTFGALGVKVHAG